MTIQSCYIKLCLILLLGMCYSSGRAQQLNSTLEIRGLGNITLGKPVSAYSELKQIGNKDTLKLLEKEFQIYKLHYTYQSSSPLFVKDFPIERLAVSVGLDGNIAAVHLILPYSKAILTYLDSVYGKHKGLTGMVSDDAINNGDDQYGMYAWLNGKLMGIVKKNMLFYSEQAEQKDQIIITLNNGIKRDYLLFP